MAWGHSRIREFGGPLSAQGHDWQVRLAQDQLACMKADHEQTIRSLHDAYDLIIEMQAELDLLKYREVCRKVRAQLGIEEAG